MSTTNLVFQKINILKKTKIYTFLFFSKLEVRRCVDKLWKKKKKIIKKSNILKSTQSYFSGNKNKLAAVNKKIKNTF